MEEQIKKSQETESKKHGRRMKDPAWKDLLGKKKVTLRNESLPNVWLGLSHRQR